MTTVLLASDKFKGSLTAAAVATAVSAGIRRVSDARIVTVPVADGGDGTVDAAVAAGFARVPVVASGPTGVPVETACARRNDTAVVEMADVSGLARLPGGRREPLTATSRGLGEVVAAAVDAGCTDVVVGIGGSAGADGGAGMVRALGARLLDAQGAEIADGGAALAALATVDLADLGRRLSGVTVTVACDVDNLLLGGHGAGLRTAEGCRPRAGRPARGSAHALGRLRRGGDERGPAPRRGGRRSRRGRVRHGCRPRRPL